MLGQSISSGSLSGEDYTFICNLLQLSWADRPRAVTQSYYQMASLGRSCEAQNWTGIFWDVIHLEGVQIVNLQNKKYQCLLLMNVLFCIPCSNVCCPNYRSRRALKELNACWVGSKRKTEIKSRSQSTDWEAIFQSSIAAAFTFLTGTCNDALKASLWIWWCKPYCWQ